MKKIIALILCIVMACLMSTIAFAETVEAMNTTPSATLQNGDKLGLGIGDLGEEEIKVDPDEPGATYFITIMSYGEMITDADLLKHLTVSVSEKGDKMLKDYAIVKHNGVYKLKLTTNAFYTAEKKSADWTITFKKDGRKVVVGKFGVCQAWLDEDAFYVDNYKQLKVWVTNYSPVEMEDFANYGDDYVGGYTDAENKYAVVTIGDKKAQGDHNHAYIEVVTAEVDIWLDAKATHKVKGVVLFEEKAAPKEIWLANPDASDITYVTFKGDFVTDYMGTLHVEADKDEFVYALVDGKFVSDVFKWNEDNKCWETKSNKFIDVVVSDVELKGLKAESVKENPGTGAYDFIGIAVAALAISAAAISVIVLTNKKEA